MINNLSRSPRLLFDQLNVVVTLIAQISDSRSSCQYSRRQLLDHPGLGCGILDVSFAKKLDVDISKVDESGKTGGKAVDPDGTNARLEVF